MRAAVACVVSTLLVPCAGLITAACATAPSQQAPTPTAQWSRLIVTFRVPPSDSEDQRRAAIAAAREALLRELASAPHRVTRTYETIPAVGLDVSPEALRVLEKSRRVETIEKDALNAPLSGSR
jgi:hypothetical protein